MDVLILRAWIPIHEHFFLNAQGASVNYCPFFMKHGTSLSLDFDMN